MGKDDSTPPPAPDPKVLAELQGRENRKTLQYGLDNSRTSTVNPFGSTSWKNSKTFDQTGFDAAMAKYRPATTSYTPEVYGTVPQTGERDGYGLISGGAVTTPGSGEMPKREDFEGRDNWTNTQALSPESQGIYDTATSKLGDATKNLSTDTSDLTSQYLGAQGSGYNQTVADAIFNRMRRYQDPADARARSEQQSNLADRGFQVGNEAYTTERNRLDQQQTMGVADAADQAQIRGASQGLAENNQRFNQGVTTRNAQMNIVDALSKLRNQQVAGVSTMPSTTTTPTMQPFDISGAMMKDYENKMDAFNASEDSSSNAMGSLLSMGGSILGGMYGGPAGAAAGGALGSFIGGGGKKKSSGGGINPSLFKGYGPGSNTVTADSYSGGGFNSGNMGGFWAKS